MSKERPMTAAELTAKLQRDAEFQNREAEKEQARQERRKAFNEAFEPYLSELHSRGFHGESLQEIVRAYSPLPEAAVSVLLLSLAALSEPRLIESVVRALGASDKPFDGRPLVRSFESTDDESVKWAIVNTVALVRPHSIDDWLSELCKSPYWSKTLRELGPKV